jgi:hypothetical protein
VLIGGRPQVISKTLNPEWNETFVFNFEAGRAEVPFPPHRTAPQPPKAGVPRVGFAARTIPEPHTPHPRKRGVCVCAARRE